MNIALTLFKVIGVTAQTIFWNIFWIASVAAVVVILTVLGFGWLAVKLFSMIPPLPWF